MIKTYFNKTLGISVTASSKQEAITKIVSGINAKITIDTGIKKPLDVKGTDILNQVLKSMPTSKTNGVTLKSARGKVILEIDPKKNDYFANDLDKSLFHLAKNLKRIVKKTCEWTRKGKEVVKQLSNKGKATLVSDCYQLYDILMDRNVGKFTYAKAQKINASREWLNHADFKRYLGDIIKKHNAKSTQQEFRAGYQYTITFNGKNSSIVIKEDLVADKYIIECTINGKKIHAITVYSKIACLKYIESFCNRING